MKKEDAALRGTGKGDFLRDDEDDKRATGMAYPRPPTRKGKRQSRRKGARR